MNYLFFFSNKLNAVAKGEGGLEGITIFFKGWIPIRQKDCGDNEYSMAGLCALCPLEALCTSLNKNFSPIFEENKTNR